MVNNGRFEWDPFTSVVRNGLSRREVVQRTFLTLLEAHAQLNAPIRASLAEEGFVLSHLILLKTLLVSGEITPSELADAMKLSNGAITALLKKLEAEGLVTRTRRNGDRRIVHVQATPKARERFPRLNATTVNELTEAFEGWAVNDIEKLRHLLTRLTVNDK